MTSDDGLRISVRDLEYLAGRWQAQGWDLTAAAGLMKPANVPAELEHAVRAWCELWAAELTQLGAEADRIADAVRQTICGAMSADRQVAALLRPRPAR